MNNWNVSQVGSHIVASDRFSSTRRSPQARAGAFLRLRRLLALAVATMVIAGGWLRDARADITTGLVGYWNLSDGPGSSNVVDKSGNGNTGALVNFTDATYNNMWTNNTDPMNAWPYALLFNQTGEGANDYVTVPDSTSLDSPSVNKTWTISAWVNLLGNTTQTQGAGIVTKGTFSGNNYAYSLYVQSGAYFATQFRNAGNTGGFIASNSTPASPNTWYHVVATLFEPKTGNSEQLMYVNGTLVYGKNSNTYTTVETNNTAVTIGSFGPGTIPFSGIIDEVRIYNRQLTQSDVTELHNNRAFALTNGGVGSWNGLAGTGGNATLDTTSLNFCSNIYSGPLGTPQNLSQILSLEAANSLSLGALFADTYYISGAPTAVASTNLTIAAGGVAFSSGSGSGAAIFQNNLLTYIVNSSDANGIKDNGGNQTSVFQNGTGTTILTGINTYSGGTTINAGTIQLGNGGALTGQELGSASSVTDNGSLVFDGNNNLNFGTSISGNGSVTQEGTGTLTLSGSNGYTNSTTIANGTVKASSVADGFGSIGSGPLNLNKGTLIYTGTGESTVRQVNGTAGTTNTIDIATGNNMEISGRVTSSAAWVINKNNGGTLTLSGSGDNSFLGANVNGGTLILNKTSGTGHAIGNPLNVASGATVQLAGNGYPSEIVSNAASPVTISSGGVFDANGQNNGWFSLILSGTGIGGTGALINSAASTPSTLSIGAGTTLAANATVGGPGSITLPNPVTGSGSLTYSGTGILSLQATNNYSGGTFITSGTVDGNSALSIPGNVTISGSGVLQLDSVSALFPSATLTLPNSPAANTVNLNYSGTQNIGVLIIGTTRMPTGLYGAGANNPSGAFTGTGLLNVAEPFWDANGTDASNGTNTFGGGSGNWNTSANNWWTGGNTDTTWAANNVAFFAGTAGVVTLNASVAANGLFFLTSGYTITNTDGISTLSLGGLNPIINVPSGTTSIGCMLTGGGAGQGLTASGPGTLILTGNNSYTGGTLVTSNTTLNVNNISDSGTSAIGTSGNLTLSTGTLAYTGASAANTARIVTSVPGTTNAIDVAPGTSLALNGSVNGGTGTAINKTDTGTLILGGATDNASLAMNINGGTVVITKASASNAHGLGGSASSVGSGAELQLAGTGIFQLFNTCALTVNSGGVLDVNSQSDSFGTFTLSGTGISGAGALINSTTTSNSFLTNGGSGVVLAGPTTVGGPGNITLASVVSGSGPITYAGTGTLSLTNANTFTAGITVNPSATVLLTNAASAGGAGAITDNGTLNVGIVGNNATLNNAMSGPGIINLKETSAQNMGLGGSMSGFTGTLNCPAIASTAKAQILTTGVNISSSATINVAAGGTLYVANSGVTIPSTINLFGTGNSEVHGALRLENGAVVSGPVILNGNTTMGNGQSGATHAATISGPITQNGGTYGITFTADPGTIVLTGTNTFGGGILISGGEAEIAGAGNLGSGSYAANITNNAAFVYASSVPQTLSGVMSGTGQLGQAGPGTLTLTGPNTYSGGTTITNSSTLTISSAGSLGFAGTSNSYAGSISNYGTLNYASSAAQFLSGSISGTGTLADNGSGTLTLSGTDIYTGPTTVASGATLAIASAGSIGNTASVGLAAGATLDVSAYALSYTLAGGTTMKAAGTSTNAGTAATIRGGSAATVNINGPLALTFTPTSFSGDTNHPALYASQGALNLNGSSTTISNAAATPLGLGTYTLVEVAGGSLGVSSTNVTVTGTGLAPGTAPTLSVSGGNLNLVVVASGATPTPGINSVTFSGGNIIFSGTNGSPNGTYTVISATNVALPRSSWTPVSTNSFSGTGTFSVTNSVSGSGRRFFSIQVP